MSEETDKKDYERGLKCELFGKSVTLMEQDELIAFIGAMDAHITFGLNADLVHPPVIMTPQAQEVLDDAINLLKKCSDALFMGGSNDDLEADVDLFLNENGKCSANCAACKNCPPSFKDQAV